MNTPSNPPAEKGHVDKALDIALRLAFVALIVMWCGRIITPFFLPVLWGLVIAVALYPVFLKLKGAVGGKDKLAGAIFILVSLAVVLAPTIWLTDSIVDGASRIGNGLQEGTLRVPPPSESVREWPAVGENLYASWSQADTVNRRKSHKPAHRCPGGQRRSRILSCQRTTTATSHTSTYLAFFFGRGMWSCRSCRYVGQRRLTGHALHRGCRGVQMVLPSSIIAWLKSPTRLRGNSDWTKWVGDEYWR